MAGITVPTPVAASGPNWSLLNSGGTATTGAQAVTISGISGKNRILVLFLNVSSASIRSIIGVRLNSDSAGNYAAFGYSPINTTTYFGFENSFTNTFIPIAKMGGDALNTTTGTIEIDGCNSTGLKTFQAFGVGDGDQARAYSVGGYYNSSSTISSISIFSGTGNLDQGTVYVYTSAS